MRALARCPAAEVPDLVEAGAAPDAYSRRSRAIRITASSRSGWTSGSASSSHRAAGEEVLTALRQPGVARYRAPEWLRERVGAEPFTWRVVALDPEGESLAATAWRSTTIGPAPEGELEREEP